MTRHKVLMKFLVDEKSRKRTYKKRMENIKKKAFELSTLCDVESCVIIYERNEEGQLAEPETWPPNHDAVKRIINKYKDKRDYMCPRRNLTLKNVKRKKDNDKRAKMQKENCEVKYPTWDDRIDHFSEDQLQDFICGLDKKLDIVKRRHEMLERNSSKGKAPVEVMCSCGHQSGQNHSDNMQLESDLDLELSLRPPQASQNHSNMKGSSKMNLQSSNIQHGDAFQRNLESRYTQYGAAPGNNFCYNPLECPTSRMPWTTMFYSPLSDNAPTMQQNMQDPMVPETSSQTQLDASQGNQSQTSMN